MLEKTAPKPAPKSAHDEALQTFYRTVCRILQENVLQSGDLKTILRQIFGMPQPHGSEHQDKGHQNKAYQRVLELLQEIDSIPPELLPERTLAETLLLTLDQLQNEKISPPQESEEIELVGWLDLAMDDAEAVIVTGMNDGKVPEVQTSDLFLPDNMRQELNLEDNRRRYVRDAYAISCILETRQHDPLRVQLITGKRSADNEPMLPSRLLFAADDETVTRRVRRFFGGEKEKTIPAQDAAASSAISTVKQGEKSLPPVHPFSLQKMNVTDFAAYKRCPYRYYLEKILGLKNVHDEDDELNEGGFGNCIHEVLKRFGMHEEMKSSRSAEKIKTYLDHELQNEFRRFGSDPRPALLIQKERMMSRLAAFADWQARWAEKCRIENVEQSYQTDLEVDGSAVQLTGKIDRIDRERGTNKLVILDYKTGNADLSKYRKAGEWVDFQLPLYYYLLKENAAYKDDLAAVFPDLGYCLLSAKSADTKEKLATLPPYHWQRKDVAEAVEAAKEIVRMIRQNKFVPIEPPPPPRYDPFAAICGMKKK